MTWQSPPSDGTSEPYQPDETPKPPEESPASVPPAPSPWEPQPPMPPTSMPPPPPPSPPPPPLSYGPPPGSPGGPAYPYEPLPPPLPPPGGYTAGYQPYPVARPRGTNTMAILSLVLALVFPPAGVVLGHIAKRQIAQTGEDGGGLATAGLIIGYVLTGLYLVICCGGILISVLSASTTTIN